jgi:hypothetical protein
MWRQDADQERSIRNRSPYFNASLLALIGISPGTYLGFKIIAEKSPGR